MSRGKYQVLLPMVFVSSLVPAVASAQAPVEQGGGSFRVQCPTATVRHPGGTNTGGTGTVVNPTPNSAEVNYTGPQTRTATRSPDGHTFPALTLVDNGGAIKCQQISGGDGFMTEADGNQTFMFSFGPLSGLNDIENGRPGTEFPAVFNNAYCDPGRPNYNSSQPNPYCGGAMGVPTDPNGAVGYGAPNPTVLASIGTDAAAIMNTGVLNGSLPAPLMAFDEDDEFFLTLSNVGMIMRPDLFEQHTVHFHGYPNASSFYDGVPDASWGINIGGSATYYYLAPDAGTYFWHCHITPPEHLQMGMVGWLYVRPRQNRWPTGQVLYQASVAQQSDLRTACYPGIPASSTTPGPDILCSVPLPAANNGVTQVAAAASATCKGPNGQSCYLYNDGDGSTRYDVDVPLQIHGFDPNFHFVGMTFNPEGFSDMKDKYFLLNGRSYPDTIGVPATGAVVDGNALPATWTGGVSGATNPDPSTYAISTAATDGQARPSQPAAALIVLSASGAPTGTCVLPPGVTACGQRAALRINDLDVQEYQTLASVGIPMLMVGFNAKLLRDQAGNNQYVKTNSITLGGGESLDVIIDSTGVPPGTYFLYTPQLDHLSNDAENFGGLMTEIVVVP
jgi:FtsP/CotA-like multicopper oxidase with cupredoxin domain